MTDIDRLDSGPRMSQAVTHNGVIYMMGRVARDRDADIAEQTRQVLERIDETLAQCGVDKTRLLNVTIYLADIADFPAMNAVWDDWVDGDNAPARTTVEARLAAPELKVEMTAMAAA